MRLNQNLIKRLAEKLYHDLERERLVTPRAEKAAVIAGIAAVIVHDLEREKQLEQDAERLLDQTISAMGKAGSEIDRRKMLRMVKEKLAKERRIVL